MGLKAEESDLQGQKLFCVFFRLAPLFHPLGDYQTIFVSRFVCPFVRFRFPHDAQAPRNVSRVVPLDCRGCDNWYHPLLRDEP